MSTARPRPRRSAALAVASVAVLTFAGCSDEAPEKDADSSASPSAAASSPGDAQSRTQIEVLGTGSGPKREVTLEVETGHEETTTVLLDTRTAIGGQQDASLPMTVPFTSTVTGVDGDEVRVDVDYGRPSIDVSELPPGVAGMAEQAVALLDGVTAELTYQPNGLALPGDVELGDGAPDLVARLLDNLAAQSFATTVPFPEEAVGVGARWQVTSRLDVGDTLTNITTTYRLTALDDDGWTVAVSSRQEADAGDTPAGKVVEGSSTATGTVTGRTGLIAPVKAATQVSGRSVVEVGGQRVETTYEVGMDLRTR